MSRIVFLIILSVGLFSCEKVIDLDLPEGETQLVVDAWYTTEDTVQYVQLSTTAPYFENQQTPRVSGAQVILYTHENGSISNTETLIEDPNNPGQYPFTAPAELGKGYQLQVDAPGFDVVRSDIQTVLETPEIFDMFWEEHTAAFDDSLAIYRVYISTYEYEGYGDFYRWFIFVDGVYQNEPRNLYVGNDDLINGVTIPQYSVSSTRYRLGEEVLIKQARINKSAYDYLALLRQQTAETGSPFDTPPAPLKGNMKFVNGTGQALGFFGASSIQKASVLAGI